MKMSMIRQVLYMNRIILSIRNGDVIESIRDLGLSYDRMSFNLDIYNSIFFNDSYPLEKRGIPKDFYIFRKFFRKITYVHSTGEFTFFPSNTDLSSRVLRIR